MRVFHDSRDAAYRTPYGAVPAGGTVSLCVDVRDEAAARVRVRLWSDARGERLVEAEPSPLPDGGVRWRAEVPCDEPELLWYRFLVERADGATLSYGARPGATGGAGELGWGEVPSFQLTVYRPREVRPAWYEGGLVYQVFPDRFARGSGWRERVGASLSRPRGGPGRALVEDWSAPPRYLRNDDGSIRCWEFYGGTLEGIRERLGYLRNLGVTALYLNPVFEAASCHRYDTADFMRIDPMLGDEADFRRLCADARAMGISVILDGVFNHVGQDSRYFNRYGNYPDVGAWQGEGSPYRAWFGFREDGTYDAWWGVADLPAVDGRDPALRRLVCDGEDSVVRHWIRAGAAGWRLDVADELDEDLIRGIRAAALAERDDALVLGEVWEDASNKVSYGRLRHYLLGDELDSAMNYPLRDATLDFLLGRVGAPEFAERMESMRENYPPEAIAAALNLMGSHDRPRLMTVLGGAPDEASLSEDQRASFRLDEGARGLAKARLWLATLVQMTMPGVPCVYYGDEAGLEGYADPYNRAAFPWGAEDADCTAIYRNAIALRRSLPNFVDGSWRVVSFGEDVVGIVRGPAEGGAAARSARSVTVLANRSFEEREVELEVSGDVVREVVAGLDLEAREGRCRVRLGGLGSAVVVECDGLGLGRAMPPGSGVICHVTSLPSEDGPGTLGAPARRFVDFLARCGQRYWQMLPVGPTDGFGSPYAGLSAFAGNVALLEGGAEAAAREPEDAEAYREFLEASAPWLEPYATFMAIKELMGGAPWQEWPEPYRAWDPSLAARPELAEGVERHRCAQYEFERQWEDLRCYAAEREVHLIGDMPMYVSEDSADVWAHPELFELDGRGHARRVAGAPPDQFSVDGQVWGNPTYDWDAMRADGYAWWVARLRRSMALFDYVRMDHFLGFANFFSAGAGEPASVGFWRYGPARELFEAAHERLGELPLVAEDLGVITPAVRTLQAGCGFPGMDVVQFCDYDPRQGYRPRPGKIAYASTHDTDTLVGWCAARYGLDEAGARTEAERMLERLMGSAADVVMMSLQDAMLAGSEARMNVPGTTGRNWAWQATQADVDACEGLLRRLAEESGRGRTLQRA